MICSFLLVGHQPYAQKMVESVRRVHDCPIVQLSDLKTEPVEGIDELIRMPFRMPLMLYRLKFLSAIEHDEMLILDTDVIAKEPIADVWGDFDVALTKRPDAESFGMPYNTGVVLSRSRQFWEDCYNWLVLQPKELHQWYGDQKAVAEVAKKYKVKELDCSEFNWSPNSVADSSKARFWHYKGAKRKQWLM